jgi:hypothetical protein
MVKKVQYDFDDMSPDDKKHEVRGVQNGRTLSAPPGRRRQLPEATQRVDVSQDKMRSKWNKNLKQKFKNYPKDYVLSDHVHFVRRKTGKRPQTVCVIVNGQKQKTCTTSRQLMEYLKETSKAKGKAKASSVDGSDSDSASDGASDGASDDDDDDDDDDGDAGVLRFSLRDLENHMQRRLQAWMENEIAVLENVVQDWTRKEMQQAIAGTKKEMQQAIDALKQSPADSEEPMKPTSEDQPAALSPCNPPLSDGLGA